MSAASSLRFVAKDLEDGEVCYQLSMTILDYDLEDDA